MRESSHPLDRPLPPDVAAGEAAFIQFYQKYAVFSWPWAWRRTAIFGCDRRVRRNLVRRVAWPVGQGRLGSRRRSRWSCAAANLMLVGAGPVLAALFRHADWPLRVERAFVVGAVICGDDSRHAVR